MNDKIKQKLDSNKVINETRLFFRSRKHHLLIIFFFPSWFFTFYSLLKSEQRKYWGAQWLYNMKQRVRKYRTNSWSCFDHLLI
jgi:hypothetical protein